MQLRQQGMEHGIQEGQRTMLRRQLRMRFGSQVDDDTVWRLGEAGSQELLRWSDRVLSEATFDDFLDEPW